MTQSPRADRLPISAHSSASAFAISAQEQIGQQPVARTDDRDAVRRQSSLVRKDLARLRDLGFGDRDIAEVVAPVSLNL